MSSPHDASLHDSLVVGTALVAVATLVVAASVPVAAVDAPRDSPRDTTPLVVVYEGETLDVSAVELTGGGTLGSDAVTLVGVGGPADGQVQRVPDPTEADFDDFTTGTYDADGDGEAEFTVTDPVVTEVVLRSERGVDVTGDAVEEIATVTLTARYNFAAADRLDVVVVGPGGVEIQNAVAEPTRITESGGAVRVDLADEPPGHYRFRVEGSELDHASLTVTLTVGRERTATRTSTPTRTATATASDTSTLTRTAPPTRTETPVGTTTRPSTARPPTASVTATGTPTPTPTDTQTPTATATPTPPASETARPTAGDGRGLDVLVALVGLVCGVELARRVGR